MYLARRAVLPFSEGGVNRAKQVRQLPVGFSQFLVGRNRLNSVRTYEEFPGTRTVAYIPSKGWDAISSAEVAICETVQMAGSPGSPS